LIKLGSSESKRILNESFNVDRVRTFWARLPVAVSGKERCSTNGTRSAREYEQTGEASSLPHDPERKLI
jgi:hypothetical protein